jgi:multiple antibiotic resistance protein
MHDFLLAFVPIFFAVDALGVLPIFLSLTEGVEAAERHRIVLHSVLTALFVAVGFVFLGKSVFQLLGITVYDFLVAGGVLLFLIATTDLLAGRNLSYERSTMGVVPLGTPLIVGPAVLTTALMLVDIRGVAPTLLAIVANVAIAGVVFRFADVLERLLGVNGTRAIRKIVSLLLAAIAVMMVRKGLTGILKG